MRAGSCVVERLRVRLPAGRCGGIGVSNGGLRVTPRTCRRHGRESSSTRRSLFGNGSRGKLDAGALARGDSRMNSLNRVVKALTLSSLIVAINIVGQLFSVPILMTHWGVRTYGAWVA